MKKIAIAGYHFSGCGVIDDLFREFDNVAQPRSECESRFLQDMDGISDLEYHLVDNPNRLTISWSISRFLAYCKRNAPGYESIYGKNWLVYCDEYINSLVKFRYNGYNLNQLTEKSSLYEWYVKMQYHIQRLKPVRYRHSFSYNYFPNEQLVHSLPTKDEFIEKTKAFIEVLAANLITDKKAEYVMFDQMIAGNNPDRFLRYVDNVKAFVVDRDPRDLYINMMNRGDHVIPTDPLEFCIYFRDIRKPIGVSNPYVMYLMIEDLIYHYSEIVPKVCHFVGLEEFHHIAPKKYFDPAISINGTRTWERYPQYAEAVKIIEQELPDFLYNNY